MAEKSSDFLNSYNEFTKQLWDVWARQWPTAAVPFAEASPPPPPQDDPVAHGNAALAGFFAWLQSQAAQFAPGAGGGQPPWGVGASAPTGGYGGAQDFARQWQQWLQALPQGGFPDLGALGSLGYAREQHLQQQALYEAIQEYQRIAARYQALLQQAAEQGAERLQALLASQAEQGGELPKSLKALYDLWVENYEAAYAEIALSDDFRSVYGALVNAQMQVRQHQQEQVEQLCREFGIPTRSEVDSLGQRLQQLRRELAALRHELEPKPVAKPAAKKTAAAGKSAAARKSSAAKKAAKPGPARAPRAARK